RRCGRGWRAAMPEITFLRIARALRDLPREGFRAQLKRNLQRTAEGMAAMTTATEQRKTTRQTATAVLRLRNAPAAIEFYKVAFDARELMRFDAGGSIPHAELEIGNSVIVVADAAPEYGFPGPEALGGSPAGIQLFVDDVDAVVARAVRAGATIVRPI